MKKIKEMFKTARSRYGTYSTLFTALAIIIVIVLNLVANKMPESWKNIDLSRQNLYEITDQSKELLKGLDKKVEIHVFADKDATDERIQIFVEKYAGLSSKVSLKWTNPTTNPTALADYNVSENTILVSCEESGKRIQIALTDIILFDEYSYYYYGTYEETGFDAEGQLTGAVSYVTSDFEESIYYTSGHGEMEFGKTILSLLDKSNYTMKELNTLMLQEIPEDCKLLLLNGPTVDLMESEKDMISAYMQKGGNVVLFYGATVEKLPNIDALMAEYGMNLVDGYMADAQRSHQQIPYYIFPEMSLSGELADNMKSKMALLIYARGMTLAEPARESISVNQFLSTSSYGYAVTEEAQVQGTYVLGATATEEGQFTVITTPSMIDESILTTFGTLENSTLFMNIINSNFENTTNVSIPAKNLGVTYNTMQYAGVSTLVVIVVIPLAILAYGLIVWLKRRKA